MLLSVLFFELSQGQIVSKKPTRNNPTRVSQNKQLTETNDLVSLNQGDATQNNQAPVTPAEKTYLYAPSTVALEGFVRKLVGDTPDQDRKFTYYVLELIKPINVKGNAEDSNGNTDSFENVTQLQFFTIGKASKDIQHLIDKRVLVKGQLLQVLDFPNFTDVMIQTNQIAEE